MKKASRSAIQSVSSLSPYKESGHLRKVNTFVTPEKIVQEQDENQKTDQREKANNLNKSIQFQIKKAREICQIARKKSTNCKTSIKNFETPQVKTNLPSNSISTQNNHKQPQLGRIQQQITPFTANKVKDKETINTECSFSIEKTEKSVKQDKKIQSLHQVRLIQSFIADEEEQAQMSFVQEHGSGILDCQICLGKASQFKILKFLNNQKYGKVYLAQSHRNNMVYSIKSIYRSVMDETKVHKVVKEMEIQSFLDHPNIVKLYNFFVYDDSAYLVMQACLGKNLYETLRDVGRMQEKTVIEWIRQIMSSVEYMHKNGVVHRNLRLQNIFLHEGIIKICDFGNSLHIPKQTHISLQTNKYSADFKVDIWSIGKIVYELIYGIIPQQVSTKECMMKMVQLNINFSKQILVSQPAKDFIMNCLQKKPKQPSPIRDLMDHQFLNQIDRFRCTIG